MANRQYGTITEETPAALAKTMQEADAAGFEVHGGPITITLPNQSMGTAPQTVLMLLISRPVSKIELPPGARNANDYGRP